MLNQNVSLSNYDPEMARIQRQQQLAEMLQQQAMSPVESAGSYGGVPAPISPLNILAKALQAYGSRRKADKADADYTDLQTKRRTDLADMLSKQYQVPGQVAQGMKQADIGSQPVSVTDPMSGASAQAVTPGMPADQMRGAIADATAARPTTPQEQMANSLSMMGSGNPQAAQMAPQLYQTALQKQQMAPVIAALPQSQQAYGAALMNADPGAGASFANTIQEKGFEAANRAPDANQQDYRIAKSQGFKGSYLDFRKQLAQTTHISVDAGAHGWQVVNDASGQPYRYNPNTGQATALNGSPLTSAPSGYAKVATPNMRNPVAIYMESWGKEHPGASAADKLTAMNAFAGQQATARTLGNIEGKVGSAANGLDIMAGQANEAYNKLGRGNFVPFNKLQQMASTNAFSSPEQADAYAADTGVINLWGKAINPSGVLTVEAQKRGEQMLSQAQSPEAHAAVLGRMVAESRASKAGVSQSQAGIGGVQAPAARIVVRTGKDAQGNKVVQYSDGTIDHAP